MQFTMKQLMQILLAALGLSIAGWSVAAETGCPECYYQPIKKFYQDVEMGVSPKDIVKNDIAPAKDKTWLAIFEGEISQMQKMHTKLVSISGSYVMNLSARGDRVSVKVNINENGVNIGKTIILKKTGNEWKIDPTQR